MVETCRQDSDILSSANKLNKGELPFESFYENIKRLKNRDKMTFVMCGTKK